MVQVADAPLRVFRCDCVWDIGMYRRGLTKQRIVRAAQTLIEDQGLEGLSMRKLASRLNVQVSTLYYHMPNKSAIVDEVLKALQDNGTTRAGHPDMRTDLRTSAELEPSA